MIEFCVPMEIFHKTVEAGFTGIYETCLVKNYTGLIWTLVRLSCCLGAWKECGIHLKAHYWHISLSFNLNKSLIL